MSSINNIALNNLQDYKQYISLMRRKALSRAENNKDYQEVNSLYRLIKISDFMLCTIEQFSLEELEDLCKIYLVADIAHIPSTKNGKTVEEVEKDRRIFRNLLEQTENHLHSFYGLEIKNVSPSDMIMRHKLHLTRLSISLEQCVIKINKYIEFYNEKAVQKNNFRLTTIKCDYELLVQVIVKLSNCIKELEEKLDSINKPDVTEIDEVEHQIKVISDFLTEIMDIMKIEDINVLITETSQVDLKVEQFKNTI